jgi:hypothetical protein
MNKPQLPSTVSIQSCRTLQTEYASFLSCLQPRDKGVIAAKSIISPDPRLIGCTLQVNELLLERICSFALATEKGLATLNRAIRALHGGGDLADIFEDGLPCGGGWPNDDRQVIEALESLSAVTETPEFSVFAKGRRRPDILVELGFAPDGMTSSYNSLVCIDFDDEWAMVAAWMPDASYLPCILGFIEKQHLIANLVELTFSIPGFEEGILTGCMLEPSGDIDPGDWMLLFCLTDCGEEPWESLDFLLPLSREERNRLGRMGLDVQDTSMSYVMSELYHAYGGNISRLYEEFGRPESPDYFRRVWRSVTEE